MGTVLWAFGASLTVFLVGGTPLMAIDVVAKHFDQRYEHRGPRPKRSFGLPWRRPASPAGELVESVSTSPADSGSTGDTDYVELDDRSAPQDLVASVEEVEPTERTQRGHPGGNAGRAPRSHQQRRRRKRRGRGR